MPAVERTLLVAAFAAWLARISGQAEVPVRVDGRETVLRVAEASGRALIAQLAGAHAAAIVAAPADLHLAIAAGGAELVYNARAFHAPTAARFAGQLATIAAALAADVDAPIARLALLPADERQRLDALGRGEAARADDELAHARFARLAAAAPDAIAVRHRDAQLSYGELAARASQLARVLIARGVTAEARVAVCVEPGLDIAVALLAVLAAGAVYVPVDPTYPPARIAAILEDTRPAQLVTHRALIDRLALAAHPTLALDDADTAQALDAASREPLAIGIAPEHTAYIYFTSGTTGKPKGVMASHGNLAFYLRSARER